MDWGTGDWKFWIGGYEGSKIGPCELQNASWRDQNGARDRQNGSPRLPNFTLTLQNHSKSIQDEKRRSKSGQGQLKVFGFILGFILGPFWIKHGVKDRMSFRGRFFDPPNLILCEILDSPTFILKRH